jgi:hypothetical protein
MAVSSGRRSIQPLAISIQPAQLFGAVSTGMVPSQVAKSQGSQKSAPPPAEI